MDMIMKVDTAVIVPVNVFPLIDDTDFKTRETAVAYNAAGMDLVWNFVTPAGVQTQTAVTPTTGGVYDWTHLGDGMYSIEIPASAGGSINNNTKGYGWFSGICTGVLAWRGPIISFLPAKIVDSLINGTDNLEVDMIQVLGAAVSTPAAAGVLDVNVKNIANAAVNTGLAQLGVNLLKIDGSSLSAHTAGMVPSDQRNVDGAALSTHAAGMIPADVRNIVGAAVSTSTAQLGVNAVSVGANAINAAAIATNAIDADALAADAVAEIQSGLALAANALSSVDWTAARAVKLDNLDAAISTRASLAAQTAQTNALITIDTSVDSIEAVTDRFDFTEGGAVNANVFEINGDSTKANALRAALQGDGDAGTIKADVYTIQTDALSSIDQYLLSGPSLPAVVTGFGEGVVADANVVSIQPDALSSIDAALAAGSNLPADVKALAGSAATATALSEAMDTDTNRIKSDVHRWRGDLVNVLNNGAPDVSLVRIILDANKVTALAAAIDESTNRINTQVKGIDANVLTSIDAALAAGANLPADIKAIDSDVVGKAAALSAAIQEASAVLRVNVHYLVNDSTAAENLKYALESTGYHLGRIRANTEVIQANALTSIDAALSSVHGTGAWDGVPSSVIVSGIEAAALSSIDAALAPRFDNLNYPDGTAYFNSSSAYSGTAHPTGTGAKPANDINEALDIATNNKLSKVEVAGSVEFTGSKASGKTIFGRKGFPYNQLSIADSTTCLAAIFENIGLASNGGVYDRCACRFSALNAGVKLTGGYYESCNFSSVTAIGNEHFRFLRSAFQQSDGINFTAPESLYAYMKSCSGYLEIKGIDNGDKNVLIDGFDGTIVIDSSCSRSDNIIINGGSGRIINNGSLSTTYNGVSVATGTTLNIPAKVNDMASGVSVSGITAEALASIDAALVAGGNLPANVKAVDNAALSSHAAGSLPSDVKAINSNTGKAPILEDAIQLLSGVNLVRADVRAIDNNTTAQVNLKHALIHTSDSYYINADVSRIRGVNSQAITLAAALPTGESKINAQVKGMDADTLNAAALAADAVTEIQAGLGTSANQDTMLAALVTIDNGINSIQAGMSAGVSVNAIGADAISSIDAALSSAHGSGAWDGVPSSVIVSGIQAGALQSIDTQLSDTHGAGSWEPAAPGPVEVSSIQAGALESIDAELAPRFESVESNISALQSAIDAIQTIDTAIQERTDNLPDDPASEANATANHDQEILALGSIDSKITSSGADVTTIKTTTTLLKKLATNKQEFFKVGDDWYLKIYDDDDATELLVCKVEKYGGGAIDDLTGTGTPSIRNRTIV